MQLEIPFTTVSYIASEAHRRNKLVILNPAPAQPLINNLLQYVYILTPNETEAEMLSGIKITDDDSAMKAAHKIREMGVKNVIVTLGSKGALLSTPALCEIIPSPGVEAIDTTAAGDVFNGALAVAVAEGKTLRDAVIFACNAAAISVTRIGAQSSAPYRNELDKFLKIT
jgi:ribokinase